jgi:nitrogen fixation protein NifU and related proteins
MRVADVRDADRQPCAKGRGGRYGALHDPDGHARITGPCGDTLEIWLRVRDGRIERANFVADGREASYASVAAVCAWAEGQSFAGAARVTQQLVLDELGGLAEEDSHCALLAARVLAVAVADCPRFSSEEGA